MPRCFRTVIPPARIPQALEQGRRMPGDEVEVHPQRLFAYCALAQLTHDQANILYTYQALRINAYRDRLVGFQSNAWDSLGWNSADWWVTK